MVGSASRYVRDGQAGTVGRHRLSGCDIGLEPSGWVPGTGASECFYRELTARFSCFLLVNYFAVGLFYSIPPLIPAHCRTGSPQSAMKPAAAASSKVLFGS
jgi:hypothetical protein